VCVGSWCQVGEETWSGGRDGVVRTSLCPLAKFALVLLIYLFWISLSMSLKLEYNEDTL
jgi:hypothetical protein